VKEILKPIAKHPGYWVSSIGNIYSDWYRGRRPPIYDPKYRRKLRPGKIKSGHLIVVLGRQNVRQLHRLVLEAFRGPCPRGMETRHLDDDKLNNRIENLVWGTRSENIVDAYKNGCRSRVRLLKFRGETKYLAQWAAELGVPYHRIQARLLRGWSVRKALTEPKIFGRRSL
jgi:hypothetical protein